MKLVIFTDLDGSFFDHADYSYDAAKPSLERIIRNAIPLIITTSKTRREIMEIQREMGIADPFISENGGGIFFPLPQFRDFNIPDGMERDASICVRLGISYMKIREFVERHRRAFGIEGFGDLTADQIAALADLPLGKAVLAKERDFTEPFRLSEKADLDLLAGMARQEDIQITRGDRFYHFTGMKQDKGKALGIATKILQDNTGEEIRTVGIGNSRNDLPMLEKVDIPVLIPHSDGRYENTGIPNIRRAPYPGSRGWHASVKDIHDEWERSTSPRRRP